MSRDNSIAPILLLLLLLALTGHIVVVTGNEEKNFYIIYMRDLESSRELTVESHIDVVSTVKGSALAAMDSIVHSYTQSLSFNAFAAKLSHDEAKSLSSKDGVLSVLQNRYHKLLTTKSWDFIGFPLTVKRKLKVESNIIVGLIDTGITPESQSFTDEGFGPPPAKWKGSCGPYLNFSGCNNKLVGARYFKLDGNLNPGDILSPIDVEGHGTHTSSTVAGNLIKDANLFGHARGTARGGVPSSRIATYMACWKIVGCADMDLLAAFDAAIADGVDIISISIGASTALDYLNDVIAIGSFHAMQRGILTIAAAGNGGPFPWSVDNPAPWMLTVAAIGTNRQFRSTVMLGNRKKFFGIGVNNFSPKRRFYPLVSGADVPNKSVDSESSRHCGDNTLDPIKVNEKLVYCEEVIYDGLDGVVKSVGGIGTVIGSATDLDFAQIYMAPATMVDLGTGEMICQYINSTRSPSAVIFRTQEVNVSAPFVASFSSRGPSLISFNVLKPDIAAPGIDILAAYTPLKSVTGVPGDTQYSKYILMSGTSMATPHVAGVAAYIKSFHPKWSPAAIRSAILTTATRMSPLVNNDAEFAYGSGLVNPVQALQPGLVYDMDQFSYIQFLCHEGYSGSSLAILLGSSLNCSLVPPGRGSDATNYPTVHMAMNRTKDEAKGVFHRTVTNVGLPQSVYKASITTCKEIEITVTPMTLSFSRTNQKRSFTVMVKAERISNLTILSGSLEWKGSHQTVRSPIVVYTPTINT